MCSGRAGKTFGAKVVLPTEVSCLPPSVSDSESPWSPSLLQRGRPSGLCPEVVETVEKEARNERGPGPT